MHTNVTQLIVLAGIASAALFAHADTAVRHVATTGSDDYDGLTVETAFKTVARAVSDLGPEGGDVYVEAGTYKEDRAGDFDGETLKTTFDGQIYDGASCIIITNAVRIIGVTGDPADVVITRNNVDSRIFYLDCADAEIRDVTLRGDEGTWTSTVGGGTVYIGTSGAVINHCIVENGGAGNNYSAGGNIYMKSGRVMRSIIRNGSCSYNDYYRKNGANVYMTGGVVENSLIVGAFRCDGPVVINGPGALVNCTVTANNGGHNIGGVRASSDAKVVNCIIYGNTPVDTASGFGYRHVWEGSADAFANCLGEVAPNDSCFAGDPNLVTGSYEITLASDGLNRGLDYGETDAISELDLAGNPRVSGSSVDIGCYEFQQSSTLEADFSADSKEAMIPCEIVLTASIQNAGASYTCKWDFDSDGVFDKVINDSPVCIWPCDLAGSLTVTLRVESNGSFVNVVKESIVFTYPRDVFVDAANAASAHAPYMTLATAAPSIFEALSAAGEGSTIHVADGLYPTNTPIVLDRSIRLESISGDPSKCVISNTASMGYKGAERRNIKISNANAVVSGFTFANGSGNYINGAAINMSAGLVTNCVIVGARNCNYNGDSCVYLTGGRISHCVIRDCLQTDRPNETYSAALSLANGNAEADNCLIADCISQNKQKQNIVRVGDNCTARNLTVVNCQVLSGKVGIYASSKAKVYNCVVANVTVDGDSETHVPWGGTASRFYNCAFDAECAGGSSCVFGTAAEFFKDVGRGKFQPKLGGPLFNAGNNDYVNSEIDLAGMPRILSRTVDIGCYESPRIGFNISVR